MPPDQFADNLASDPPPTVSVAIITYNHERFITQALESVLSQRTTFPFEIVVGNDASRDRTAARIDAIAQKWPDRLRVFHRETNLGMLRNLEEVLAESRGEFVAFLEGDDYWTVEDKLQKQVDILRRRPDVAGVCHPVIVVNSAGSITGDVFPQYVVPEMHTRDLLNENPISTPSTMVRRHALGNLSDAYANLKMRDWPMWVYASLHGPWLCEPTIMAAYRVHDASNWSSLPLRLNTKYQVELFRVFAGELPRPHAAAARRTLARKALEGLELAIRNQCSIDARSYMTDVIRLLPYYEGKFAKRLISALWEISLPETHRLAKRSLFRR